MLYIFTFLLELVRVVIILFAGLALLFFVESRLFMITLEGAPFFLLLFANTILILVFYRNKFQFSGWYKGKEAKSLPPRASKVLIFTAFLAIVTAFFL
ncbi:hypothetical protein [Brevibacillus sp. 179-C9.3 HS]|uniref:hypothetical protein n=1 Tax=unclassified Brevibacillus TaxID=2684853 RepID=UPI00399F07A2